MATAGFAVRHEAAGAQLQAACPKLSSAVEPGERECRVIKALRPREEKTLFMIFRDQRVRTAFGSDPVSLGSIEPLAVVVLVIEEHVTARPSVPQELRACELARTS